MTIIRVSKDKDNPYVMVNKCYLENNKLSLKAKGLLTYLLSKPDDWKVYLQQLKNSSTDSRDSINSAMKELINKKYITRIRKPKEKGKFKGHDYTVYEKPTRLKGLKKPETVNRSGSSDAGKPYTENRPLLINDSTNNELTNISPAGKPASCKMRQNEKLWNKLPSSIKYWCSRFNHMCLQNDKFCMGIYNKIEKTKTRECKERKINLKTAGHYGAIMNGIKDQIDHPDSWLNAEVKSFLNKIPEWPEDINFDENDFERL